MMDAKYFIKHIKEEIDGAEKYHEMAEHCKGKNETEMAQYFSKLASDECGHASMLFKMMEKYIDKMTEADTYTGVYKDIYELSMDVLKDDYKEVEEMIKKF